MTKSVNLSIVMPVYNEEGIIREAIADIYSQVCVVVPSQLIVVDDGSQDRTAQILDELSATNDNLTVIRQKNSGHGSAIMAGLNYSTGEYVLLLDSDRQIPLDDFKGIWTQALLHDAIFGVRSQRQDPQYRLILSSIIRFVLSLLGSSLQDANAPFKIFRRQVWLDAKNFIPAGTLAPSMFLALFIQKRHYNYTEIALPHRARMIGEAKIQGWKLFKFCSRAFSQLLSFHLKLNLCAQKN